MSEYENNKKKIKLNNMKNMKGIIVFINNKFVQLIVNPYANTYSVDEIQKILDMSTARRSIINNKPINEGMKILKSDIYNELIKI